MARAPNKRRQLVVRWSLASGLMTLATIAWVGMSRRTGEFEVLPGAQVAGLTSVLSRTVEGIVVPIRFEDVTERVGIDFHHMPVPRESLLPEDMGSGVACGDFDADGFTDLYFVNFSGSVLPDAPMDERRGRARLYRNVDGAHFEDVTDRAGVGFVGFGMGAAWGDYDNDGDLDLYVTSYGGNVLYRNRGDGTFDDVTQASGVQDTRFSTGCSWADYDRDGDLDLYVCNYVNFVFRDSDRRRTERQYATEQPYTLNPSAYPSQPNALFRNNGDGTFTEVAAAAGVADPSGRSLSASWVDLNNDGWPDLYVANDVSNNGVFLNNRDGTFSDVGASSLAADYRGAMGIAVADLDNDLDQDLLITHWIAQENALFRNMTIDEMLGASADGRLWFMDDSASLGLGQVSLDMVGWATGFCDLDNDGLLDLWVANGSTLEQADNHRLLQRQRSFLFWNRGGDGFLEVAARCSARLAEPMVVRGGAHLDFDRDGLIDLIFVVHGGRAIVLRNDSDRTGHWLRVVLRQVGGNTHAVGGCVYVTAGGRTQMAQIGCSSSYLSQNEPTLHFGLGDSTHIETLRIVWPDGVEETHHNLSVDREITFEHRTEYPIHMALEAPRRQPQTRQDSGVYALPVERKRVDAAGR
ncbi:MAG: CRTAC1 family protein [Planctomycetes bacterium]|nr:CRTAC1 family protein [Planctomycetota bacterium]